MLNLVDTVPSQLKALKYTPLETLVTSVARKLESVCSSGGPVDWPNRTTTVAMVHADDTSLEVAGGGLADTSTYYLYDTFCGLFDLLYYPQILLYWINCELETALG